VTRLPFSHRVAHRLARSGLRGASWYWRLSRSLQHEPKPGLVWLPDGTPLIHDPDDWTCRSAYEGTYEREILRLLDDLLDRGDSVVDVGANVGIITSHAAHLVGPTGRVVAVEPSPRCLEDLRRVADEFSNVTVLAAALGPAQGTVELTGWDNPDHRGLGTLVTGHRAGLEENWHDGQAVTVPQVRLHDLIGTHLGEDSQIALLKVDVEGYEPAVLAGAPMLFTDMRVRSAILEVTPSVGSDWVGELVAETSGGYDAFAIGEAGALRRKLSLTPVSAASAVNRSGQWNLLLRQRD
jgi:FkbM family methyltransferase